MNTINVDNDLIIVDSNEIYLKKVVKNERIVVNVSNNVDAKLIIYSEYNDYELTVNIEENSNLIINSLNNNVNCKTVINIYSRASLEYNYSIVANKDSLTKVEVNHLAANTRSIINNNGVNLENNKLFFEIDGIIKKDIPNCEVSQYSKIINYASGNSKIIPNLIIDNNDVCANHSAYIGSFKNEDMFYIKSRGISEREAYRLLYRSLLLGKMKLDIEEELFNKLLKEWGLL